MTATTATTVLATRATLSRTIPWLLLVSALITAGFTAVGAAVGTWGEPTHYIASSASWGLHWAGLAGGVAAASCVPVLVAHGLSRRTVGIATIVTVLLVSLALAGLVMAGLGVEWLFHQAAGSVATVDGGHLYRELGQVHLMLAEYGLMFAGFAANGWLIHHAYLRLGPRWGTLALPVTALPMFAVLTAIMAGWVGPVDEDSPPLVNTLDLPPALALAAAGLAAALLVAYLLTRTLPIRTK